MKATRGSTLFRWAALTLFAACFTAGLARAQAYAGKFTLPYEVRWGHATLPAGNYSFTLDKEGLSGIIQVSRRTKHVALIMSQGYDTISSGRAELTVVRDGSGNTVRNLRLSDIGMVFRYAPPKAKRNAADEREARLHIPVMPAAEQ